MNAAPRPPMTVLDRDAGRQIALKSISFCVSCRNRLWQLRQTLPGNLECIEDDVEICLVDYGSSDGLADWIRTHFSRFIESGRLVFFEVLNPVSWNSPKAKNLAHRIANGDYLFNLDADNFIDRPTIEHLREARRLRLLSHQWTENWADGSFGRIGLPRGMFFELGGYDESLLPMGGQDIDLLDRIRTVEQRYVRLPPPARSAIQNDAREKVSESRRDQTQGDPKALYETMNRLNLERSKFRLGIAGAKIEGGFASYRGRLNGVLVILDGFGNLTRLARPTDRPGSPAV